MKRVATRALPPAGQHYTGVRAPDCLACYCAHFVGEAVRVPPVVLCRERMGASVALLLFDHDFVVWGPFHPEINVEVTSSCHLICHRHLLEIVEPGSARRRRRRFWSSLD